MKIRKNPYNLETRFSKDYLHTGDYFEKLLQNAENVKLINNLGPAIVYYFELKKEISILGKTLAKGQYILKWQRTKEDEIEYLRLLSNLKLIPKILLFKDFDIWGRNSIIMIMEYFNGIDLQKLLKQWDNYEILTEKHDTNLALRKTIWRNIEREYERWIVNDLTHGDLQAKNIMISTKGKIIFIDPLLYDQDGYRNKRSEDLRELKSIKFLLIGNSSNYSPF